MDFYSLSLLSAMVAAGISLLAAILGRLRSAGWNRAARFAALAGIALCLFSGGFHLTTGHRPGTPEALGGLDFLAIHPALIGTLLGCCLGLWIGRKTAKSGEELHDHSRTSC